ncbi:ATP-binding protein [Streptomyces sp. LP05-1]|uniref:ATP-binding protein n=1 Tax=Streptomyces pyxinae TaxID=2970734 RepID=A0ABT2CDE4_9ACTN|nr:ATP-binding protein [Streptomyces sp. LP05-1]MCS0635435.1 ATP-binding protein [Streptomyces sp. LP05-1]
MSGRQAGAAGPAPGERGPRATGQGADGPEQGPLARWHRQVGPADLKAVREIRQDLRELLRHWGGPGSADVAELLTSELVTNALIHTERGAVVTATLGPAGLRVEVRDFLAAPPTPHRPSVDDGTHGRGLVLVDGLADAWGVRGHGVGKVVWFELSPGGDGGPAGSNGSAAGRTGTSDAGDTCS